MSMSSLCVHPQNKQTEKNGEINGQKRMNQHGKKIKQKETETATHRRVREQRKCVESHKKKRTNGII